MKANLFFVFLILAGNSAVKAQNLVLNPGFENYISCPGFGQFGYAWVNDWTKPSWGSSDYYHVNCPGIQPAPPGPHTGNGEAGIILYNFGTEYREYITGTLSQPLSAGQSYYVEFFLALNPGYIQAVQEAGAWLSDSVPGPFANSLSIPVVPQVKNNAGFLTYGWQKVSGNYVASGGEEHITIGNFYNDSNTTTLQVGSSGSYGAYYFVDDVYVGLSDSASTGIRENEFMPVVLYPNPVQVNGTLFLSNRGDSRVVIELVNATGFISSTLEIEAGSVLEISNHELKTGFYYYLVRKDERILSKGKLIVFH